MNETEYFYCRDLMLNLNGYMLNIPSLEKIQPKTIFYIYFNSQKIKVDPMKSNLKTQIICIYYYYEKRSFL